MISILHISDLHIIVCAEWNNMKAALLEEAKEKVYNRKKGEKLLIITGDFHNFNESSYCNTEKFLRQLFDAMNVDPAEDVFVIPGNHDVGNTVTMNEYFGAEKDWKMRQKASVSGIKNGDKDYIEWRLESFAPYCKFVQDLGIYTAERKTQPAEVHIRTWRNKLNILHLNTALVADGTDKDKQQTDTYRATDDETWKPYFKNMFPTLALGHNSFFDLERNQQTQLSAIFARKNVSAYLCGDRHRRENNPNEQVIRLKTGLQDCLEIPNIICMKGAAYHSDYYSEFGFYWHDWDEKTDKVTLDARNWKRDGDQSKFISISIDEYYVRRKKKEKMICDSSVSLTETGKTLLNLPTDEQIVQKSYFDYLSRELGIIRFDGMPADKNSATVKAELERIFVPLKFRYIADKKKSKLQLGTDYAIGEVLSSNNQVAILAKPGGGKSTLIRRIALAYAFSERRMKVDDCLPDTKWFPIHIRCRDLGENVQNSIIDIIFSVVNRAELSHYKAEFEALIVGQLRAGCILLLIDGLDEISNEQYRIRFVDQLQTFVDTYPTIHLFITSRETGFRAVAQKLGRYCLQYSIADLDESQIRLLSEKWHRVFLDDQRHAKDDSDSVCRIILQDSRITALAQRPLLLTTLLFVKRWIGYLPTKKCQLYQEMIKLLLVSWNAEAHLKMDMDEAEPQLAFVAYRMTTAGRQTIRKTELIACINDARKALPELLGYTKISPSEFIDQVERRSSILIQKGLEEDECGNFIRSYEFSHLSFQEYLTAKAISEKWLPESEGADSSTIYLSHLKKNYDDDQWLEVFPLAAVLLKRQAKPAMEYLLKECEGVPVKELPDEVGHKKAIIAFHLSNCIACEIPLPLEILEPALLAIAIQSYSIKGVSLERSLGSSDTRTDVFKTIYHSEKYGGRLKSVVENELFENINCVYFLGLSNVWLKIYYEENGKPTYKIILQFLNRPERKQRIFGALLMMEHSFRRAKFSKRKKYKDRISDDIKRKKHKDKILNDIFALIKDMLVEGDAFECFAASWCIAWAGYNKANIIPYNLIPTITENLVRLWCNVNVPYDLRRTLSWAICTITQKGLMIEDTPALSGAIAEHINHPINEFDQEASTYLQFLLGEITVDDKEKIKNSIALCHKCPTRFMIEIGLDYNN